MLGNIGDPHRARTPTRSGIGKGPLSRDHSGRIVGATTPGSDHLVAYCIATAVLCHLPHHL